MFQKHYLWQQPNWFNFTYDTKKILGMLSKVRKTQGKLLGVIANLGYDDSLKLSAKSLEEEAIQTFAIEGEKLNRDSVRSSLANHLGLVRGGIAKTDKIADGAVQVLLDATNNFSKPLTKTRLVTWHRLLFPTASSGLFKVRVGEYRDDVMQVVSGVFGRATVHYEAIPPEMVASEMKRFFNWWKSSYQVEDGLIRAGIAHLYFVTIHPFDDGNGRLARALIEMALAQDEGSSKRAYSLSAQIQKDKKRYYAILEKTQKGDGDITEWLMWFLRCFEQAVIDANKTVDNILAKSRFWLKNRSVELNEHQRKVLNKLLDYGAEDFIGGLTTRKYVSIAKVSRSSAWRDIDDLLSKELIKPSKSGSGRSTAYVIKIK